MWEATFHHDQWSECADSCRDYCWLPCMVKDFDQHSGYVEQDCACEGNRDQMCENVTGSVKYYTECLNKTHPCPSPSFVDFADFYFNWLSDEIITNTCPFGPQRRSFRRCVESSLRSFVDGARNCTELDQPFQDKFVDCLNQETLCYQGSPLLVGIDIYMESNQPWLGANLTRSACSSSGRWS